MSSHSVTRSNWLPAKFGTTVSAITIAKAARIEMRKFAVPVLGEEAPVRKSLEEKWRGEEELLSLFSRA